MTPPAIPADLKFRFDSRLDPLFFDAFTPEGALRRLVEYADSAYPVDVHFRRDWVSNSQHASLHVGLNRVLDLEYRQGVLRMHPLRALRTSFGFESTWLSWHPLPSGWPIALEVFLDQAIPWAADNRGAMGAMAAARFGSADGRRSCLSQSFAIQFRDERSRKAVVNQIKADIEAAFEPPPIDAQPHPLKAEADVLYIDSAGDLLIGDAYARRAAEVPWAAGIALVNARLLRLWLGHDPFALDLLIDSIRTRVALGLLPPAVPLPTRESRVVPIVQVQSGMSPRLRANAQAVAKRLRDRGVHGAAEVQIIEWSLSGRETVSSVFQ